MKNVQIYVFILLNVWGMVLCYRRLTAHETSSFKRDGYILIKGLLHGDELEQTIKSAKQATEKEKFAGSYKTISFNDIHSNNHLHYIATESDCASVVSQLMGNTEDIRILKDAILVFEPNREGCGWHVDDPFFWPSPVKSKGHPGINVWITLSPIRQEFGGGLAIAPTSHRARWLAKARSRIWPNFMTCKLEELSPRHHKACEKLKTTFDMEPGDAIVHTRWLWHRSHNFSSKGVQAYKESGSEPLMRYSVRYMPGETPILSNPTDTQVTGHPLNEAPKLYPQINVKFFSK